MRHIPYLAAFLSTAAASSLVHAEDCQKMAEAKAAVVVRVAPESVVKINLPSGGSVVYKNVKPGDLIPVEDSKVLYTLCAVAAKTGEQPDAVITLAAKKP